MDKEMLEQHISQRLSTRGLAKVYNCSQTTIRYWLNKYELKTDPKSKQISCRCCKCGETDSKKFYGRKKRICGKCHNKETLKLGKEKRFKAIRWLGGKCVICSYNKYMCSLDIHHLDPDRKDPNFNRWRGWSMERIYKELKRCTLVCKNCHAALHNGKLKFAYIVNQNWV